MKTPEFKVGDLVFNVEEGLPGIVTKINAKSVHMQYVTVHWYPSEDFLAHFTVISRGVDSNGDIYAVVSKSTKASKEDVAYIDPSIKAINNFKRELKELLS